LVLRFEWQITTPLIVLDSLFYAGFIVIAHAGILPCYFVLSVEKNFLSRGKSTVPGGRLAPRLGYLTTPRCWRSPP